MKSRARNQLVNTDNVILVWQTMAQELFHPAPPASQLRLYDL
jgi:hypothetical protein